MITFSFQGFWMYLLAGLGEMTHKTSTIRNAIVAAFMLYAITYNVGVNTAMREQPCVINVLTLPPFLDERRLCSLPSRQRDPQQCCPRKNTSVGDFMERSLGFCDQLCYPVYDQQHPLQGRMGVWKHLSPGAFLHFLLPPRNEGEFCMFQ